MLGTQALALLSLIVYTTAAPQYSFGPAAQCNDPGKKYNTEVKEDASVWRLWDGSVCQAPCELASQTSTAHTVSYSWTVGGEGSLSDAIGLGLEFGMEVATTEEKATVRNVACEGATADECHCGLIFMDHMERAKGQFVKTFPDFCSIDPQSSPFEVVAPVKKDGKAWTEWEACRSSLTDTNKCKGLEALQPCPDGA